MGSLAFGSTGVTGRFGHKNSYNDDIYIPLLVQNN